MWGMLMCIPIVRSCLYKFLNFTFHIYKWSGIQLAQDHRMRRNAFHDPECFYSCRPKRGETLEEGDQTALRQIEERPYEAVLRSRGIAPNGPVNTALPLRKSKY